MAGFDVLTDCQKGCVKPVMKSIGCADSDFKCFCSKDVPSDVGLQMVTCMLTNCLLDSADPNLQAKLVDECKKEGVTVSAGSDILGSLGGATSSSSSGQTSTPIPPTATSNQSGSVSSVAPTSSRTSQLSQPSASDSSAGDSPKPSGLSAGAAAGIGVAGAVIVMLLILGTFLFWRRRRREAKAASDKGDTMAAVGSELGGTGIHEVHGSYTHTPEVEGKHPSAVSSPSPTRAHATQVYELQGTSPEAAHQTREPAQHERPTQ
ncbi:hypothetical protein PWT90_10551 [Aphanocladium album]|nr:hypothetical protein PWT90_10551 [Aphanocladium album]